VHTTQHPCALALVSPEALIANIIELISMPHTSSAEVVLPLTFHDIFVQSPDLLERLLGVNPFIMEREGATTGNAPASELHVQTPVRASSASEPFYQGFHPGISCDRSGKNPIVGMRFHLRGSEPSYDLCQAEYDKLDDAEKGLYEAIPPPPPGLKLEGGSLEGAAGEYMGEYRLAVDDRVWPLQAGEAGWRGGPMLVNGRPAWRHTTHLTHWLAFDGVNWRGQPEASLGQKSGVLLLSDAAALSPDASSATWWLAANGPGTAGAAQPQLKCIPCAAPPLSRVELPVKNFRGPCAARCKPLAPCCCVSADGEAIFGCVPTDRNYTLPACLHMALCPQLGCDPNGGFGFTDYKDLCLATLITTLLVSCQQTHDECCVTHWVCFWEWRCGDLTGRFCEQPGWLGACMRLCIEKTFDCCCCGCFLPPPPVML